MTPSFCSCWAKSKRAVCLRAKAMEGRGHWRAVEGTGQ